MMKRFLLAVAVLLFSLAPVHGASQTKVVVSIRPLHALVSSVMQGVDEPLLLISTLASPHDYALRPSEILALEEADIVFWIGDNLEVFLKRAIKNLRPDTIDSALFETEGLIQRSFRKEKEEPEHNGHDHHHDNLDAHIWLDPVNARIMARKIASVLSRVDPENADTYALNTRQLIARLDILLKETNTILTPVREHQFFVFHDAYRHFQERFHLKPAHALSINPAIRPGAGKLRQIENEIAEEAHTCIFSEPQFNRSIVDSLTTDTGAASAILDPLGSTLKPGPKLYFNLIKTMATTIHDCLSTR